MAGLTHSLLVLVISVPATPHAASESVAKALTAFRRGDYPTAARTLSAPGNALAKNPDYRLHFLAESYFYLGAYAKARASFATLARIRDSRFAAIAPWRVADCLWMEDRHQDAAAAYRKLSQRKEGDVALARFRIAEAQAETAAAKGLDRAAVARAFLAIHVDFPAHPLGIQAGERAARLAPAAAGERRQGEPSPRERLQRADLLSKGRHYEQALAELALLPEDLPAEQAAERDLAMGMAKYRARRDYAGAARLLLSVAPRLPEDKAAFAAFHGARALSRIDRDDEAIVQYRNVVARYPSTSWAAHAQFRAGWLEINRGHFREALPDLRAALIRFPHSRLADDAAWYLALAYHLLGENSNALSAITTYEEVARGRGEDLAMRALYFRARILLQAGRAELARGLFRECAARSPFNYYALLARTRLRELGEPTAEVARPWRGSETVPLRDGALARVFELENVGLDVEAGLELVRAERGIIRRHGKLAALSYLLPNYQRLFAFHHAYKVAQAAGAAALGDTRLFWESAYPRAYPATVEKEAKSAGVPTLFAYAIMRKESAYHPFALSRSDARGLLQLIPSTSRAVAKRLGTMVHVDELFDPETNIRLGVAYLGELLRQFGGQEALAAGAYNAGERAMMRWCDLWRGRPLDEFVELITYDQAREYIKRVLSIYARYRYIYGEPLELSLSVDTQYLNHETAD
jgi:soluble lytic murein transglycosylase